MTWIISLIEKVSDDWLRVIVSSSVQLTIFLSIIGIIAFIFRKKSARFLYFLWLIGLFRIFLPPNFDFLFKHTSFNTIRPDFIPTIQIQPIVLISGSEAKNQMSMQDYLFLFWFAGVMIFVIYWLFNYFRFRRMIGREARPFVLSDNLKEIVENSRVKILTGKFIATPFVRGLFRPKIYLPENAHRWPKRELKAILYHELAHIQCKDLFLIVIQNAVQMIYFFHPLVWLANMQIFRYREKARDDMAIEKMGGNALAYGKYLLTSMDNALEWQPMYSASHYFLQSKSFLYQRFEYILNRKEKIMNRLTNLQKGILVGCLILGLALAAFQSDIRSQTRNEQKAKVMSINVYDQQNPQGVKVTIINGKKIVFVAFDEPPEPEGGFAAIQKNLVYPRAAQKAGKEGMVMIYTKIEAEGAISDAIVGHSTIQDSSCEAAALEAVKSVTWKPAKKDGKPISVWITVPIKFTLHKVGAEVTKPGMPQEAPPPPPPSLKVPGDSSDVFFVPYDEPPKPIGGFAAIQRNLRYPALARKAGVEGTVIIYAFINENGEVEKTKIAKSLGGGNNGCDEAAIEAIKSVRWEPAKQRDKNVAVWVSVPVKFKLSGGVSGDLKKAEQILRKVEKDLQQKQETLKKMQNEKAARELKKIGEELQKIQQEIGKKHEELQDLDKNLKQRIATAYDKQMKVTVPAPDDSSQEIMFVPFDKPPTPEGGFKAIQKNLVYPESARQEKIEGTVILFVQVTEEGKIAKVRVQKSLGENCDQAAIDAVKSVKWKPAEQKGKPVAVWVSVPVVFKLK